MPVILSLHNFAQHSSASSGLLTNRHQEMPTDRLRCQQTPRCANKYHHYGYAQSHAAAIPRAGRMESWLPSQDWWQPTDFSGLATICALRAQVWLSLQSWLARLLSSGLEFPGVFILLTAVSWLSARTHSWGSPRLTVFYCDTNLQQPPGPEGWLAKAKFQGSRAPHSRGPLWKHSSLAGHLVCKKAPIHSLCLQ
jgi:hypothetical protein